MLFRSDAALEKVKSLLSGAAPKRGVEREAREELRDGRERPKREVEILERLKKRPTLLLLQFIEMKGQFDII